MNPKIQSVINYLGEGDLLHVPRLLGDVNDPSDSIHFYLANVFRDFDMHPDEPTIAGFVGVVLERLRQDYPKHSIFVVELDIDDRLPDSDEVPF